MAQLRQVVEGAEQVIRNIRSRSRQLARGCERGVKLAAAHLLRESQLRVPVDTANLKGSGVVRTQGSGFDIQAAVAYTAFYALFVHENVEMKLKGQPRPSGGNYWDPPGRGQAKFLEEPARTEARVMRAIIKEQMRVKT